MPDRRLCVFLLLAACSRPPAAGAAPSAPPAKLVGEGETTILHLTEEAEQRLGIAVAAAAAPAGQPVQWLPGRTMSAPGATIVVQAPFAGRVAFGVGGAPPFDRPLPAGAPWLLLTPLAGADARASLVAAREGAQGRMERAAASVSVAKTTLARAERLFADQAGSARAVDDAKGSLQVALAEATAAQREQATLDGLLGGAEAGREALPIAIGREAMLRALHVVAGQCVPAGAPLAELEDRRELWLRIDVPLGMRGAIEGEHVEFAPLGAPADAPLGVARLLAVPPAVDAATGATQYFGTIDNTRSVYAPGEPCRVAVRGRPSAGGGHESGLVVPASAVVYDAYGGAWLYERRTPHEYRRRRVDPARRDGDQLLLARGPAPGTEVVVTGAAELFGTEFGTGK